MNTMNTRPKKLQAHWPQNLDSSNLRKLQCPWHFSSLRKTGVNRRPIRQWQTWQTPWTNNLCSYLEHDKTPKKTYTHRPGPKKPWRSSIVLFWLCCSISKNTKRSWRKNTKNKAFKSHRPWMKTWTSCEIWFYFGNSQWRDPWSLGSGTWLSDSRCLKYEW